MLLNFSNASCVIGSNELLLVSLCVLHLLSFILLFVRATFPFLSQCFARSQCLWMISDRCWNIRDGYNPMIIHSHIFYLKSYRIVLFISTFYLMQLFLVNERDLSLIGTSLIWRQCNWILAHLELESRWKYKEDWYRICYIEHMCKGHTINRENKESLIMNRSMECYIVAIMCRELQVHSNKPLMITTISILINFILIKNSPKLLYNLENWHAQSEN